MTYEQTTMNNFCQHNDCRQCPFRCIYEIASHNESVCRIWLIEHWDYAKQIIAMKNTCDNIVYKMSAKGAKALMKTVKYNEQNYVKVCEVIENPLDEPLRRYSIEDQLWETPYD